MSQAVLQKRRIAWGRVSLIAILCISLLGNAVVIGAVLRAHQLRVAVLGDMDMRTASYPPDIRKALRQDIMAHSDTLGPALQAAMAARAEVIATSTAEPFDRAATEAAMAAFRVKLDVVLDLTQGVVLGVMEERASEG